MQKNFYETVIVGAGISGLACAKKLSENQKDFAIISPDIGGRIFTSRDGKTNYGAFFVCSDYYNLLKYTTINSRIKLSDFSFHNGKINYKLYELSLVPYFLQFYKIKKLLYKFRKSIRSLRKNAQLISQKKAIENDSFLFDLYMRSASEFVKENNLEKGTKKYLSQALYSTTFSKITEMNAFSFLQFLLPLITPIYTFTFEKDRMINSFRKNIIEASVKKIIRKNNLYNINYNNKIIQVKNVVLATQINWSKNILNITKTNKSVDTNMFHIKGIPKEGYSKKLYHLFTPPDNTQAIANLNDGTFLFYYKRNPVDLNKYFLEYSIVDEHKWSPAGTINGHELIESYRDFNMYLIGDYNIAGLEESFITGIYAANQIMKN